MTEPHEGPRYEQSSLVALEDLQLMADLERARDDFISQAYVLYDEPTVPENYEDFRSFYNTWLDSCKRFVRHIMQHGSSFDTGQPRIEVIAAQYLHEDQQLNNVFAATTGNDALFYPTDSTVDDIVRYLNESEDEDPDPNKDLADYFIESLVGDVENFEAIALAMAQTDDFGHDYQIIEQIDPALLDGMPIEGQPVESRRSAYTKRFLRIAGNIATVTLGVYLGNKLSRRR